MPNGGRYLPGAAVLAALERLPLEHTVVLPASARRRGLRGCDLGVRRLFFQGPQGGTVRLQPLLQEAPQGQPLQAPHRHTEGCAAEGYGELIKVRGFYLMEKSTPTEQKLSKGIFFSPDVLLI